ncbi:MAG: thioredoxin-disulfide reductase [Deltaproteobacteria bacterium]|nr:MAG: thioredoxin-disulfide reductase [Deltaproteobacteria bacterium]
MLDLAIVGGGPAGLSAGLYASRGGLKNVVLFEPGMPGGQITQSSEIENYPGQKECISGIEFMEPWVTQAKSFGMVHEMKAVKTITKNGETFTLALGDGSSVEARAVIVATGNVPRRAGFKGEDEFFGRGISTCATCDGFFYKDKDVAIIGGGDSALEEALYMSKIAKKVYLIHRRDTFRASPPTIKRCESEAKIEMVLNASPKEARGDDMGITSLVVAQNGEEKELKLDGIFTFVGRLVKNETLKDANDKFICDVDAGGQVIVDMQMRTSLAGLFAAGDLRSQAPKQVVCAASDGATAALSAIAYIEGH